MAEEGIKTEKIEEFIAKVTNRRANANCKDDRPNDIALNVARNLGLGSAVMPLTYAALRNAVERDEIIVDDVCFWIEAAVGVSAYAGGFVKEWLDAFNEQFFVKVSCTRDFPSPYSLKLSSECAKTFKTMLQAAVACAESKGKVGKIALNKCIGFRAMKYWSDSEGWCAVDGFGSDDREMLKAIVERMPTTIDEDGRSAKMPVGGELAEVRKRAEMLQEKLKEEQSKLWKLESQLQATKKSLEQAQAELDNARATVDTKSVQVENYEQQISNLKDELEQCRADEKEKESNWQRTANDFQRQIAKMENDAKTRIDAIAEVVSPIRQQVKDAKGMAMSIELGEVLLAHVNRIVGTLQENGFEV